MQATNFSTRQQSIDDIFSILQSNVLNGLQEGEDHTNERTNTAKKRVLDQAFPETPQKTETLSVKKRKKVALHTSQNETLVFIKGDPISKITDLSRTAVSSVKGILKPTPILPPGIEQSGLMDIDLPYEEIEIPPDICKELESKEIKAASLLRYMKMEMKKDYNEAKHNFYKAVAGEFLSKEICLLFLSYCKQKDRHCQTALDCLAEAENFGLADAELYNTVIELAMNLRDFAEAEKIYNKALDSKNADTKTFKNYLIRARFEKNEELARKIFEKAAELKKVDLQLISYYVSLCGEPVLNSAWESLVLCVEDKEKSKGEKQVTCIVCYNIAHKAGNFSATKQIYHLAVKHQLHDDKMSGLYFESAHSARELEEASFALEHSEATRRESWNRIMKQFDTANQERNFTHAQRMVDLLTRKGGTLRGLRLTQYMSLAREEGEDKKAIEAFNSSEDIRPSSAFIMIDIFIERKQLDKAVDIFNRFAFTFREDKREKLLDLRNKSDRNIALATLEVYLRKQEEADGKKTSFFIDIFNDSAREEKELYAKIQEFMREHHPDFVCEYKRYNPSILQIQKK